MAVFFGSAGNRGKLGCSGGSIHGQPRTPCLPTESVYCHMMASVKNNEVSTVATVCAWRSVFLFFFLNLCTQCTQPQWHKLSIIVIQGTDWASSDLLSACSIESALPPIRTCIFSVVRTVFCCVLHVREERFKQCPALTFSRSHVWKRLLSHILQQSILWTDRDMATLKQGATT